MMSARNLQTDIPTDLKPLVNGFLIRRAQDVLDLERFIQAGDLVGVRAIAHRLKGSGAGYGFPVITEVGRDLEEAAKAGATTRAEALVREFREIVQHFRRE